MIVGSGFVWVRRIGLGLLTLFVALPLYAICLTAFLPPTDVRAGFRWIPRQLTLEAFGQMWSSVPLGDYLVHSLVVSATATAIAIVLAVPAGYALARLPLAGRRSLAGGLLVTQAVPGLLFLVPLFLLFGRLDRWLGVGLRGSYVGLVLVSMTFALPFSVLLLANFFHTLPRELEESAWTMGAGPVQTLVLVVLPNALAGIAAVTVFAFSLSWGEVLFTSVLSDEQTRTLAVGLSEYATDAGVHWSQLTGAAILAAAPVVVVFLLVRRHLAIGFAGVAGDRPGSLSG